ncbi:hypothetical protein OESDEN_22390 [Oesophagostomum dentatum]|uniref:Uncharacterized protein n=1 Tax=Oesophagostomum dentatum TaxID=61180 RepID=A0A0B1S426_OESDE|nr:hypothetical protein OESDEN_22390 [Oesophagostomum dentatum]
MRYVRLLKRMMAWIIWSAYRSRSQIRCTLPPIVSFRTTSAKVMVKSTRKLVMKRTSQCSTVSSDQILLGDF